MQRPKFKMNLIVSGISTVIVPMLPEEVLTLILKIHIIPLTYLLCFIAYSFKLYKYSLYLELLNSEKSNKFNDIEEAHSLLKIKYKKVDILLKRHENVSSRFIDDMILSSNLSPTNKQKTYITVLKQYNLIKQDELGKYASRKDDLDEENICD